MALALLVAACATTGETRTEEEPTEEEINLAEYEDFDPSPYREEPPREEVEVQHDVPERLMAGGEGREGPVKQQGFRIQIFSSIERDEAEDRRAAFSSWWDEQKEKGNVEGELPTYMMYKQPYYRVRVGNFTSRSAAQRLLERIEEQFGEAFIVPTTVVVRR